MNVFLSCVLEKANKRCKAIDMYSPSILFSKSYAYAKSLNPDRIYILSAKHHLLNLDDVISPYNETLNDATVEERKEWTEEVVKQMKAAHIDFEAKTYFFCGNNYIEFLREYFPNSESLYDGKRGIGDALHWLDEKLKNLKESLSIEEYIKKDNNMKTLKESIVHEAREITYRAMIIGAHDRDDGPITVTISVEKENQKAFEDWLEEQEGNIFTHAEGGTVMY